MDHARSSARHRLRRARPRDRGVARGERLAASRRALSARGIAQPARSASRAPCATPSARIATAIETIFVAYGDCGTGGALDAVLREENVERIPGAHCYEFFAGSEIVRGARGRGARHVLPHRFPAPPFRPARDPRPGARPPSGARRRTISATTGASSISRRSTRRSELAPRARQRNDSGSRSRTASPATADWSAASARPSSACPHGKADRHLLARRAVAGRRQAGPRYGSRAAFRALPGSRRPRGDARGKRQVGRLHRRLEARRAARLRRRPQSGGAWPKSPGWKRTTPTPTWSGSSARRASRRRRKEKRRPKRTSPTRDRRHEALMHAMRHWSVRHSRGLETFYRAFERAIGGARPRVAAIGYARSSGRWPRWSARSRAFSSTAGCAGNACSARPACRAR